MHTQVCTYNCVKSTGCVEAQSLVVKGVFEAVCYGSSGWRANRCSLQCWFIPTSGCATSERRNVCLGVGGTCCANLFSLVFTCPPKRVTTWVRSIEPCVCTRPVAACNPSPLSSYLFHWDPLYSGFISRGTCWWNHKQTCREQDTVSPSRNLYLLS